MLQVTAARRLGSLLVFGGFPLALLLVLAIALPGCGNSGQVKVYPVKGRVMYEGKPMVGGGAISLVPVVDQPGKTAAGTIQPDGTFVLGTYTENDGSMTGEFRVVIFQETVKEGTPTADGTAPGAVSTSTVAPADRIPLIYANDRESPLQITVEPKANELVLELKRQ
jgi:hypothetical protein